MEESCLIATFEKAITYVFAGSPIRNAEGHVPIDILIEAASTRD